MSIGLSPISSVEQAFSLIDASGAAHVLGGATGYDVLANLSRRWFPEAGWIENRAPNIPGTILQNVTIDTLDFPLPILVTGDGPAQLHQRLRQLVYWLDPRRGDIALQVTAPDGVTRRITCRVRSVDVPEDGRNRGHDWQNVVTELHAADPYWYAEDAETATYSTDFDTPAAFLNPAGFFPLSIASSVLFAAPTIDNDGDTESWPTWRIVGPGTNPSLRNITTGEAMVFTRTLAAGDTILVELSRESVIVTDSLGTRLYSVMANTSKPWPIRPGINRVQIGMDQATDASSITLEYLPRFIGP